MRKSEPRRIRPESPVLADLVAPDQPSSVGGVRRVDADRDVVDDEVAEPDVRRPRSGGSSRNCLLRSRDMEILEGERADVREPDPVRQVRAAAAVGAEHDGGVLRAGARGREVLGPRIAGVEEHRVTRANCAVSPTGRSPRTVDRSGIGVGTRRRDVERCPARARSGGGGRRAGRSPLRRGDCFRLPSCRSS